MCSFSGATYTSRDVTMQITFLTRKSALIYRRDLRQRVASLTLNCNGVLAIRAYGNQRTYIYGNAKVMADCDNGSMHNHSLGSSNVISSYVSFA